MKNYAKLIVLAVAFFGITGARAAKKVEVTVNQELNMVNVSLIGVSVGESLIIKKFKGAAIYKKVFNKMVDFEEKISLKGVENGVYFVEVENDDKLEITPVLKNDLGVTLIEKAAKVFIKPEFKNENGNITFSLKNPEENVVSYRVATDAFLIKEEKGIKDVEVKRTLNITRLKSGSYTIAIKTGSKTFVKEFKVL